MAQHIPVAPQFALPVYKEWHLTREQATEQYGFRALFGEHRVPRHLAEELNAFDAWSASFIQLDR